jgi:Fucose 4-O-acetylase and related acetyltransferases
MEKNALEVARGIGIASVVLGHIHVPFPAVPPQMYHMALFFFLGGVGISASRDWGETGRYLLFRFIWFALAINAAYFIIAYAIDAVWGVNYLTSKARTLGAFTTKIVTANAHHVKLALTNWFLVAYCSGYALAFILIKGMTKLRAGPWVLLLLGVALCIVGVELGGPKGMPRDWVRNQLSHLTAAGGLMLLGYASVHLGWLSRITASSKAFFIASTILVATWTMLKPGTAIMAWSTYPAGVFGFYAVALSAITLIICVSVWAVNLPIAKPLAYLGKNSKWIMAHHIAGFAIVNLALVTAGYLPPEKVGALTTYNRAFLWPIYALVGFGLPLILSALWSVLRDKFRQAKVATSAT